MTVAAEQNAEDAREGLRAVIAMSDADCYRSVLAVFVQRAMFGKSSGKDATFRELIQERLEPVAQHIRGISEIEKVDLIEAAALLEGVLVADECPWEVPARVAGILEVRSWRYLQQEQNSG